jgi:hypothetical protein
MLDKTNRLRGGTMATKLAKLLTCFEQADLIVMEKAAYEYLMQTIEKQAEEIDALELRIKRLLDTSPRPPHLVAPPRLH